MTEKKLFTSYYETNKKAFRNFSKKLSNDLADADDLFQESLLKAYKSFHSFKKNGSFKSWVFTIMKNTFLTKIKKRQRKNVIKDHVEDIVGIVDEKHYQKNKALSNLRLEKINSKIDKLSNKSRFPFKMHLNGYKYDEIARELEIPVGTVKSRINYARNKLKNSIDL